MTVKYPGKLGQPPPPLPMSGLLQVGSRKTTEKERAWSKEMLERWRLLLEHYGLEWRGKDTDWANLAIRLAQDHVPAFRWGKGRGRPRTSDTVEARQARGQLLAAVEAERCKHGAAAARPSIATVCQRLAGEKREKLPDYYRKRARLSGPTLKRDYLAAKREARLVTERMAISGSAIAYLQTLRVTRSEGG